MAIYTIYTRKADRKLIKVAFFGVVTAFALVGMTFSSVFMAMRFGLLNVQGVNSQRNSFYDALPKSTLENAVLSQNPTETSCLKLSEAEELVPICAWNQSEEWQTVRAGIEKDAEIIQKVSHQTGVSPRMIVATIMPEQLRFFTSSREVYKSYFEPLKILGSMTTFSLGIAGMKQGTARQIELYTVDTNSPFYPGEDLSKLLEYPEGKNTDAELYNRLTSDDHYYSYLYTALFIRQITAHWASYGYDVSERPDVVVTLFNIGMGNSEPKSRPQIGGTTIYLNGETYSFGELGTAFYMSDELTKLFPR